MRPRCPSVNVGVESIYCQAKWSGGKRLPDLGGGSALPVGIPGRGPHLLHHVCTLFLDGDLAGPQLGGDLPPAFMADGQWG